MTAYTQNLQTLNYEPVNPVPIADFSWKPGKKLNGQNGYVYELLVQASVTTRARAYFFLRLASGDIVTEYVDITFSP